MEAKEALATTFQAMRVRITKTFPDQIRAAVAELTDDQLWWRPNEQSNSVGNLVLHLTGSLNHYVNRQIGGIPFERHRDAEFAERKRIPREELMARFNEMVANAETTFASLTVDRLGDPSPEPKMHSILVEDIVGVATHIAAHTAQILWITKALREGALDDLWIRTHRQSVWKTRKPEA